MTPPEFPDSVVLHLTLPSNPSATVEFRMPLSLILAAVWHEAPDLDYFARNPEVAAAAKAWHLDATEDTP